LQKLDWKLGHLENIVDLTFKTIGMEGLTMENTGQAKEFKIPIELLKAFRSDIRTLPHNLPHNGYIIFDHAMLISILRDNDAAARIELAKQLEKYAEAKGKLVMMAIA
jgi:hypothetical protein